MIKTLIVVDVIKLLEDEELYALHKLYYRANDISYTANLFTSKEETQSVLDSILEVAEKVDIQVKVRWLRPQKNKKIYMKRGDNLE